MRVGEWEIQITFDVAENPGSALDGAALKSMNSEMDESFLLTFQNCPLVLKLGRT